MTAPIKHDRDAAQWLDPEHPDFFEHCREMAIQMLDNESDAGRETPDREYIIQQMAATIAYLALDDAQTERFGVLPGLPWSFGGKAAGSKRRRKPKATPGGHVP